jgi:putative membrane protein
MSTNTFLLKHLTVEKLSLLFILILFCVGFYGLSFSDLNFFARLTPVVLAFGGFLVILNSGKNFKRIFYLVLIFTVGYLIEVIGVKTGMVFGWYKYGNNLGPKIMDVPVLMGINWLSLLYGAGMLGFLISRKIFWQWFWAAFFMMLIDIFIEPLACKLDFWCWNNATMPPLQNFGAWFLISFILVMPFRFLKHEDESRFAAFYFIIQLLFFVLLNMTLTK